ncbi:hypothetical protein Misp04_21140 [Micromonospora sp. NBRC 101691]|nr:hypothetical protein Misp04_21140 [Micromonospora sp. NBRC 101691]
MQVESSTAGTFPGQPRALGHGQDGGTPGLVPVGGTDRQVAGGASRPPDEGGGGAGTGNGEGDEASARVPVGVEEDALEDLAVVARGVPDPDLPPLDDLLRRIGRQWGGLVGDVGLVADDLTERGRGTGHDCESDACRVTAERAVTTSRSALDVTALTRAKSDLPQ